MQVVAEVCDALRNGEAEQRRFAVGDFVELGETAIACCGEQRGYFGQFIGVDAGPGNPHGEHEREAGPALPAIAQVPNGGEAAGGRLDCAVTDQQDGVGRGVGEGRADGERFESRSEAELLLQQNLDQRGARSRAFVERERGDRFEWHAAEQLDA